jgi:hypothetical protein
VGGWIPIAFEPGKENLPPLVQQYQAQSNLLIYFNDLNRIEGERKDVEGRVAEAKEKLRNAGRIYESAEEALRSQLARFRDVGSSEELQGAITLLTRAGRDLESARTEAEDVNIRLRSLSQGINVMADKVKRDDKVERLAREFNVQNLAPEEREPVQTVSRGIASDLERSVNVSARQEELSQKVAKEMIIQMLVKSDENPLFFRIVSFGGVKQQGELTRKLETYVEREGEILEKIRDVGQGIEKISKRIAEIERKALTETGRRLERLIEERQRLQIKLDAFRKTKMNHLEALRENTREKYQELDRVLDRVMPALWQKQLERLSQTRFTMAEQEGGGGERKQFLEAQRELILKRLSEWMKRHQDPQTGKPLLDEGERLGYDGTRLVKLNRVTLEAFKLADRDVLGPLDFGQGLSRWGVGVNFDLLIGKEDHGELLALYHAMKRAEEAEYEAEKRFVIEAFSRHLILRQVASRVRGFESQVSRSRELIHAIQAEIDRAPEKREALTPILDRARTELFQMEEGLRSLKAEKGRAIEAYKRALGLKATDELLIDDSQLP